MKTGAQTDNRFQTDAARYAAYLETPEGRLRLDLAFANLQEFLPRATTSLHALDIGCGTGVTALRLAGLGVRVTLLDSSPAMLNIARGAAIELGVADKISPQEGTADQLASLFHGGTFDLIVCHNVLEYVDDPAAVLFGAASLLRDSSSLLSVLVRNRAGEVFKAAIQGGDLEAAEDALTSEWGQESLYRGKVRLFTLEKVREMLKASSFRVVAERGVRVVSDYLPSRVSRRDDYERIFELERKLGVRAEFAPAARYTHSLARLHQDQDKDRG
jgi:S-adenosylmethionine-dependent methyltransferase